MRAKTTSDKENLGDFKNERANIVECLEEQYRRISSANAILIDFVKEEKRYGGLFDVGSKDDPVRSSHDPEQTTEKLGQAMSLVEEFADSFKRYMTVEMKRPIVLHRKLFDSFYSGSILQPMAFRLRSSSSNSSLRILNIRRKD